jgi:hypothetical protein
MFYSGGIPHGWEAFKELKAIFHPVLLKSTCYLTAQSNGGYETSWFQTSGSQVLPTAGQLTRAMPCLPRKSGI